MKTDTMYRVLVGTVFTLLITLVLYVGTKLVDSEDKMVEEAKVQDVVVDNKNVSVYNEEQDTKKEKEDNEEDRINVIAKYVDIYSECDHEMDISEQYYNSTLDTVRNIAKEKHQEYSLSEESGNILVFERVYKGKCPNHFLVKIEENNLCIYRINLEGEYEIYQQTEIAAEFLREGLTEKLKDGVYVNGLSELFVLLEDIES